jgi:hypothetical protein
MPKLQYVCKAEGCFNRRMRPKVEVFDDLFPRGCAFGDMDYVVEMGHGRLLILEWKNGTTPPPNGQARMYLNGTARNFINVLVVYGNAETMVVSGMEVYRRGIHIPFVACDLDGVRREIAAWVEYAERAEPEVLPLKTRRWVFRALDWLSRQDSPETIKSGAKRLAQRVYANDDFVADLE